MRGLETRIHRHLDPSESLLELLFGLVMAFTITAGARLLSVPGEIAAGELAIALLGCNVAWGVIDGAFYLLGSLFNRNRRLQLVRQVRDASSEASALALIEAEIDLADEPEMRAENKAAFYKAVLRMLARADTRRAGLRRDDLVAAALIALLVSATALPAVAALLLVADTQAALRVANFVQIGLLFLMGYGWAHYSGARPWQAGLVISLIGLALILVAVALGG